MVIKGFFFDLDGTLVNTHESNFRAYRQAVEELTGKTLGDELKESIKSGQSSSAFLPALLPELDAVAVLAIRTRKKEIYPDHLKESELNEYLSSFLAQISEDHVTALVTTSKHQNGLEVIRQHGLEQYFNFTVFGDEVGEMKPSPEAYQLALKRANLTADEVLAFEDSPQGIAAAEAAGIRVVHIRHFNA